MMGILAPEKGRQAPSGLSFAPVGRDTGATSAEPVLHAPVAVEAVMIAEGSLIRVGPRGDDLIQIEELGVGDPVWDCILERTVEVDTIACATCGPRELADQGLRLLQFDPYGTIAITSPRLRRTMQPDAAEPLDEMQRVFYRLWPETRLHLQISGVLCLIAPAKWC